MHKTGGHWLGASICRLAEQTGGVQTPFKRELLGIELKWEDVKGIPSVWGCCGAAVLCSITLLITPGAKRGFFTVCQWQTSYKNIRELDLCQQIEPALVSVSQITFLSTQASQSQFLTISTEGNVSPDSVVLLVAWAKHTKSRVFGGVRKETHTYKPQGGYKQAEITILSAVNPDFYLNYTYFSF